MTIIGFGFKKMAAERKEASVKGKIDIKNNVAITGVEESKVSVASAAQKVAKFDFDFDVSYEPKLGVMKFSGDVLYLGETKNIDEIVEKWKKDKTLPKELMANIINTILSRCNIQALILSQQVNLPPPMQLPRVQVEDKKKK